MIKMAKVELRAYAAVPLPSVELRSPSRSGTVAALILIDAHSQLDRRGTDIGELHSSHHRSRLRPQAQSQEPKLAPVGIITQ